MNSKSALSLQAVPEWLESHQGQAAGISIGLAALIALVDWRVGANVSLGALYIFAVILASLAMPRSAIILLALICSVLREEFGPFRWQPAYEVRLTMIGGAFGGLGLLVSELNRNRKLVIENLRQRERFLVAQQEADRQLSTLVNTSPLPILIAKETGEITVANEACRTLLDEAPQSRAPNLFDHLPELRAVLGAGGHGSEPIRREIECSGKKNSGEPFFAHVWLTAYRTGSGANLAVVLWDASEDLRGRENANIEALMTASRVSLAGFAHEVRNVTVAALAIATRLSASKGEAKDADCAGLTATLSTLAEMAATALRLGAARRDEMVDLRATMEQVRIVLQPVLENAGIELVWNIAERLPRVCANHSALLQIFINLARNSECATRESSTPQLSVTATGDSQGASIVVCDNGPGVAHPENLFRPFRSESGGTGLGLYVSRSTLRSFGGDMWHEPETAGACFRIRLRSVSMG